MKKTFIFSIALLIAIAAFSWSRHSQRPAEPVNSHTENDSQTQELTETLKSDRAITLSTSIEADHGETFFSIVVSDFKDDRLRVEFENHDQANHSVMACLDGSTNKRRYPFYELEVVDDRGKPVPQREFLACGNLNPWRIDDFIDLAKGDVYRIRIGVYPDWQLTSGYYKIRLKYTAKRDLRRNGLMNQKVSVNHLMKNVWEGTLYSNWVSVEITDPKGT